MAGLWSSLSGAGRFVSRSGTGILVDHIGFQMTAVIVFAIQLLVVNDLASLLLLFPVNANGLLFFPSRES